MNITDAGHSAAEEWRTMERDLRNKGMPLDKARQEVAARYEVSLPEVYRACMTETERIQEVYR